MKIKLYPDRAWKVGVWIVGVVALCAFGIWLDILWTRWIVE